MMSGRIESSAVASGACDSGDMSGNVTEENVRAQTKSEATMTGIE